ncbi:hypothetical protein CY35_16G042300 [Sphagnum magellanicum]|nr:hypothetical protein CY35_16G042300 [Sphagnum magellanicum]
MASEGAASCSAIRASAMGSEGAASCSEIRASAMGSEGAASCSEIRASAMGSEGAAIVPKRRRQPRKMSEANNDAKTSFEKRLRPARNLAGTHCSFGVRSWKEKGNRRDGFYGEVRLVDVPGWIGPNRVWIPKCSTLNELARGIDAVLFFSGEVPHYFFYPEGHFDLSENAKETETVKSFLGRMETKYSKDDRELKIRTPISAPASASSTAEEAATAEESEDNANPHRNPTIAESSTNVTDDDVLRYIRFTQDLPPSRDCVELNRTPGFGIDPNREAMPGAQNHSPDGIMSCDEVVNLHSPDGIMSCHEIVNSPLWDPMSILLESDLED